MGHGLQAKYATSHLAQLEATVLRSQLVPVPRSSTPLSWVTSWAVWQASTPLRRTAHTLCKRTPQRRTSTLVAVCWRMSTHCRDPGPIYRAA